MDEKDTTSVDATKAVFYEWNAFIQLYRKKLFKMEYSGTIKFTVILIV